MGPDSIMPAPNPGVTAIETTDAQNEILQELTQEIVRQSDGHFHERFHIEYQRRRFQKREYTYLAFMADDEEWEFSLLDDAIATAEKRVVNVAWMLAPLIKKSS